LLEPPEIFGEEEDRRGEEIGVDRADAVDPGRRTGIVCRKTHDRPFPSLSYCPLPGGRTPRSTTHASAGPARCHLTKPLPAAIRSGSARHGQPKVVSRRRAKLALWRDRQRA